MNYNSLLDMATELGYYLAMSGAETFRVEDSVTRILSAYGLTSDVFSLPNCLIVSIETEDNEPITRMRRIGFHGNDLDSVERFGNLSRTICAVTPDPQKGIEWIKQAAKSRVKHSLPVHLLGNFLGAAGFGCFYGCNLIETVLAGLCGILGGLIVHVLSGLKVNNFFTTIFASLVMSFMAYSAVGLGLLPNADTSITGALMILVPGLLFTNAMRDIILGDTYSGINRIVQVCLVAIAIALGSGFALNRANLIWGLPTDGNVTLYTNIFSTIPAFAGCIGFSILFNVRGKGSILCALGGCVAWTAYCIAYRQTQDVITSSLIGAIVASAYAEIMARIRKYPAISYLVVSLFPLLPGAGIYLTTRNFVNGDMAAFASKGVETIAIAAALAIGILFVFTIVQLWRVIKKKRKKKK